MEKEYIYITNIKQVKFYLEHGVKPIDIGVNNRGVVFYQFVLQDTREIYTLWKATKPVKK